ncbi:unnamed protein product [Staurois parvus]|uniref:Uncharacterized protein n=1 Tax=Staurois parvus TaxID=386267 RepID=A0ABN9D0I1_9NEOB|nr:unnamed protein product [Staurois parvus]
MGGLEHLNHMIWRTGNTFGNIVCMQGRTDNSWGPRAIGDHGPLCPCPNSKKPMKKVPGTSNGAPY